MRWRDSGLRGRWLIGIFFWDCIVSGGKLISLLVFWLSVRFQCHDTAMEVVLFCEV